MLKDHEETSGKCHLPLNPVMQMVKLSLISSLPHSGYGTISGPISAQRYVVDSTHTANRLKALNTAVFIQSVTFLFQKRDRERKDKICSKSFKLSARVSRLRDANHFLKTPLRLLECLGRGEAPTAPSQPVIQSLPGHPCA